MRCTAPKNVGFTDDGRITFSQKKRHKELDSFKLPCGKCLSCRLIYAREWAVRCVHEAQMHEKSCFITLTYSDEHLSSPKLVYSDFQKFMKKLRKIQDAPIGVYPKGEYGEEKKRPHWHAIIFNWRPSDLVYRRTNVRGDRIYTSETLEKLWSKNDPEDCPSEIGDVTIHSAGYVARYASKKLIHGRDQDHEFHPIGKPSSKHAIGKKWIEKFHPDVFSKGYLVIESNGKMQTIGIPRYYERWYKENHPKLWFDYVTQTKARNMLSAGETAEGQQEEWLENLHSRAPYAPNPLTLEQIRAKILQASIDQLNKNLKL